MRPSAGSLDLPDPLGCQERASADCGNRPPASNSCPTRTDAAGPERERHALTCPVGHDLVKAARYPLGRFAPALTTQC